MEQTGRFVSGEKIAFAASGKKKEVQVFLPPGLAAKFGVESKSIPDTLVKTWNGYQITWINNIGLKAKTKGSSVAQDEYYEVQFTKPQSPGTSQTAVVYWDGKTIQPIDPDDYEEIPGEMVAVRLQLIDPPIGWGTK
jgi:hypothetical protein